MPDCTKHNRSGQATESMAPGFAGGSAEDRSRSTCIARGVWKLHAVRATLCHGGVYSLGHEGHENNRFFDSRKWSGESEVKRGLNQTEDVLQWLASML
jgi:hypothetical protein